jgi:hypothetical protein
MNNVNIKGINEQINKTNNRTVKKTVLTNIKQNFTIKHK